VSIKRYSTEGIIISRKNFSEADRILKVYTKHFGKLTLIAKGIRKPKSRKRGSLEVFGQIRFSASMGKNLDIMLEVEIIDSFDLIRKDLKKVALAYYFLEVVDKLTQDNEKNVALYEFLQSALGSLKETTSLKNDKKRFVVGILTILGFWPANKKLEKPDEFLESVTERRLSSPRVGKKLLA